MLSFKYLVLIYQSVTVKYNQESELLIFNTDHDDINNYNPNLIFIKQYCKH